MTTFLSSLQKDIDSVISEVWKYSDELVRLRRHFHENPELSWDEVNTSKVIKDYLANECNIPTKKCTKTGIIGLLKGKYDGKCILLRADMDALPVNEESGVKFSSKKKDVMHACGHDAHCAIMLIVAKILSSKRDMLHGTIKFCFQPAEEIVDGANKMIEAGVLENPHVDECYGLHVWSHEPFGKILCPPDEFMAGSSEFHIKIIGQGGHGAHPELTKDAIVAQSQLIAQLHTIISRNVGALECGVLSVGKVRSGVKANVISDKSQIAGTIRWFKDDIKHIIKKRMLEVCNGIKISYNLEEVDLKFPHEIGSTINHLKNREYVKNAALRVIPKGFIGKGKTMGAEDFSSFIKQRPGAFFFVSAGEGDGSIIYPHHKSNFRIDERCLMVGTQTFCNLVFDLLGNKNKSFKYSKL